MWHLEMRLGPSRRLVAMAVAVGLAAFLLLGLFGAEPARAAVLPSTYYVPLPEDQLRTVLLNMAPGAGTTIHTVVSIVASANGTLIYYDEWEDGYEPTLGVRTQATTQIWGDNNPANGIPPGYATDVVNSGSVITLENDVVTPRSPATILYDGRDKIGATYMLAVTRAGWALNPGTVLAGALEVHRTLDYGLDYRSPVGTNVAAGDQNNMFDYTSMLVLAGEDGTTVQIDADNNGTFEINTTLAQGQSYLVNGGVRVGGRVLASKPVSVDVITGDRTATYESRFFSLYPVSLWAGNYYSPVGSSTRGANTETTYVFVYNPGTVRIRVTMQNTGGTTRQWVDPGTYARFTMAVNNGAQFFSQNGEPFFAISCVGARDASNQAHDWGFTLIPESSLTTMTIVGWGPGRDAASATNPLENASPVWVTPVANTTVYVDYDADPATGPLVDPYGNRYNVAYVMNAWQSQKVYDTVDRDQTGLRLYTVDGTLIATAWGQDPTTASTGAPALDLGTTVLPLPEFTVDKTSALAVDVDGDGFVDPGDTITYTIRVDSVGPSPLRNISVVDPLPANTTYVPNSTTYALYTASPAPVADDATGTPYPLDGAGKTVAFVTPYQYFTYTFRTVIANPLPLGVDRIQNQVTAKMNVASYARTNDTTVGGTPSITRFAHSTWATVDTYAGDAMLYLETTDLDQNMNPGVVETIQVTVTSATGGDSEVITLTETGPNTGIFRGSLLSSTGGGAGNNNGLLRAPVNDVLTVTYVDPDFPTDTSSAVANIRPTLALVTGLSAWTAAGGGVVVEWTTQSEIGTLAFHLLRMDPRTGAYRAVTETPVPGLLDSVEGGTYRVVDPGAKAGGHYTYKLLELEAGGASREYGPFVVRVEVGAPGAHAPAQGMERVPLRPTAADAARATVARSAGPWDSPRSRGQAAAEVKIMSVGPGLVRVTAEELAGPFGSSAGVVATALRQGRLALTFRGAQVAYLPAADGSSFVFYDPGASGPYSDVNVFWVSKAPGLLMTSTGSDAGPTNLGAGGPGGGDTTTTTAGTTTTACTATTASTTTSTTISARATVTTRPPNGRTSPGGASADRGLGALGGPVAATTTATAAPTTTATTAPIAAPTAAAGRTSSTTTVASGPSAAAGAAADPAATFTETARAEVQTWSATTLFSDPEADYWLWDYVVSGVAGLDRKTFTVRAEGAAGTGAAVLVVRLVGVSTATGAGNHHVSVTLNGASVGDGRWTGGAPHELTLAVPGSLVRDGDNLVGLTAEADVTGSIAYLDRIDLRYQRLFRAVDDRLPLRGDGNPVVTVRGFAGPSVRVFDVSDPAAPVLRADAAVEAAGGVYQVTFAPAGPSVPYLAVGDGGAIRPAAVIADAPSGLRTAAGAEYVIVAPPALVSSAQRLASYRSGRGLSSLVVDLQDVYDEFNGGMASPHALKDFLSYAYANWRRPPRFLVLAGAGTSDYMDYRGFGGNLLPPLMVSTPDGLSPSDQTLGDVRGDDGVPEIAVGRLPVLSAAELDAQVSKIRRYESSRGDWTTRALFVADDADDAGDFPADSDALASLLDDPYEARRVYLDPADPSAARSLLFREWTAGAGFVSYLGHAGLRDLTGEGLFGAADAAALVNGTRLPVAALMTCTAGHYAIPGFDSLAETLVLNQGGGAIAVLAPSGLSRNPNAVALEEGLVRQLYVEEERVLGTAMIGAMRAYADQSRSRYTLDIYNLMGDPALAVR